MTEQIYYSIQNDQILLLRQTSVGAIFLYSGERIIASSSFIRNMERFFLENDIVYVGEV